MGLAQADIRVNEARTVERIPNACGSRRPIRIVSAARLFLFLCTIRNTLTRRSIDRWDKVLTLTNTRDLLK